MGRAKEIVLKVIPSKVANDFIRKHHYSGKVVPNSNLHFGAFLDNKLHGVMSYGPSINKKGTINLVEGTGWNEFIELNRMAFDNYLPRNSESRCGDGTIYRASNFVLTDIRKNEALRIDPKTGAKVHVITAHHKKIRDFRKWKPVEGYQFRYIYFIDKSCKDKLTVPIIPFSKIKELGVGMYLGEKR